MFIKLRDMASHYKEELYEKTGISTLNKVKIDVDAINTTLQMNKNLYLNTDNAIKCDNISNNYMDNKTQIKYFQPELDFDREPELFDECL